MPPALIVTVLRATGLSSPKDGNTVCLYVQLKLGGKELKHTRTINCNGDPVWNEACSLHLQQLGLLQLVVRSRHHLRRNDYLGTATFDLHSLRRSEVTQVELPLDGGEGILAVRLQPSEGFPQVPSPTSSTRPKAPNSGRSFEADPNRMAMDWQAVDALYEAQQTEGLNTSQQLLVAIEKKHPDLAALRTSTDTEYLRKSCSTLPGDDYDGPRLRWPLRLDTVVQLMVHYTKWQAAPLHEGYLCRILSEAITMFSHMPPVTWISSQSGRHTKLVVVGDLHGQLADLLTIFMEHGLPNPAGTQYLFNGDLVDRGEYSIEVVTLILAFKLLYPNSVHVNRGNHESEAVNVLFGFYKEVSKRYPGTLLFNIFGTLWNNLPIATVIDDSVLVIHGGLFRHTGVTLQQLNAIPKQDCSVKPSTFHEELLCDCLWSDPSPRKGLTPSRRGADTVVFGPDITRAFLEKNHLKFLIRSHQVPSCNGGFEWMHDHRLVTVFSASNYCNKQGNRGGVLVFEGPTVLHCVEYYASPMPDVAEQMRDFLSEEPESPLAAVRSLNITPRAQDTEKVHVVILNHLRGFIRWKSKDLTCFWQDCAEVAPGCISRDDWSAGLHAVLDLNIHWPKYEPKLLPVTESVVNWRLFLDQFRSPAVERSWITEARHEIHQRLMQRDLTLSEYFGMFNKEDNAIITLEELQQGLRNGVGISYTVPQLEEMVAVLCPSKKPLDVMTFLESIYVHYTGKAQPPEVLEMLRAIKSAANDDHSTISLFKEMDRSNRGKISCEDLAAYLNELSGKAPQYAHFANADQVELMMRALDTNSSGLINIMEFMHIFKASSGDSLMRADLLIEDIAKALSTHEASLQLFFVRLGANQDTYISIEEFQHNLSMLCSAAGMHLTPGQLALVTRHVDTNNDKRISCREFLRAFDIATDQDNEKPVSCGWLNWTGLMFGRRADTHR